MKKQFSSPLIYSISKQHPDEIKVSVVSFKSY